MRPAPCDTIIIFTAFSWIGILFATLVLCVFCVATGMNKYLFEFVKYITAGDKK